MRPFALLLTGPGLAMGLASGLAMAHAASAQDAGPAPVRTATQKDDASPRAGFVGRWKLNQDLSEDPVKKMREARPLGGGGGAYPGAGGGRGGGRSWGGGGRRGGGAGQEGPRGRLMPPSEVTVTQLEPEIVLVEPEGHIRTLHPDGHKYKNEADSSEVETHWDGARLLVESTTSRGSTLTEAWSLSPDHKQLTVLRKMEGPSRPAISVRTVYDTGAQEPPAPASPANP